MHLPTFDTPAIPLPAQSSVTDGLGSIPGDGPDHHLAGSMLRQTQRNADRGHFRSRQAITASRGALDMAYALQSSVMVMRCFRDRRVAEMDPAADPLADPIVKLVNEKIAEAMLALAKAGAMAFVPQDVAA